MDVFRILILRFEHIQHTGTILMASFVDLPIDLLPIILRHIVRPNHLAANRLVNRSFDAFAAPRLFEEILIFAWHKDAKSRVNDFLFLEYNQRIHCMQIIQLFRTLADCPQLAKWVKRLGK